MRLMRRGDGFSIRLYRGRELKSSRLSGSEEALATLSIEQLGDRPPPRLLIGGLGIGFTLRAAPDTDVAVAIGDRHRIVVLR